MTPREKVFFIRKQMGYTQTEFAKEVGTSVNVIKNIESGRTSILDARHILEAISNFTQIPVEEIESGKITISSIKFRKKQVLPIEPSDDESFVSKTGMQFIPNKDGSFTMLTPHVTEYARAGYLGRFADENFLADLPPFPIQVTEVHKGVYRSFTVVGDSMDNGLRGSIGDGDVVTGRLIQRHLWTDSKLHLKKVNYFVINHMDGLLVKEIIDHNLENKTITVRSLNPDKESYPDETILLNGVREIYNVVYRSEKM